MERAGGAALLWLRSILVALSIAWVVWAALNLAPKDQNWEWIVYPGGLLGIPGLMLAGILAAILSHGFHSIDKFDWVIVPFNLVFYFALSFLAFRRISRKRNSLPGQTQVGNIDANGYAARWRAK
jgi:hypothetical protein